MKIKLFLISFLLVTIAGANPPIEEGKAIFTARCASCHNVNKQLTGPALSGVHERRDMKWIINFVKSSQTMVKNGDKDAIALFEKFNKIPMPDHSDLNDQHINSIIEYIKSESANSEVAPFAKPKKQRPNYLPLTLANYGFFLTYIGVVLLMIIGLVAAVHVKTLQREAHKRE